MTDDVKFAPPALTFDDVLLLPAYSQVMPSEADTAARAGTRPRAHAINGYDEPCLLNCPPGPRRCLSG